MDIGPRLGDLVEAAKGAGPSGPYRLRDDGQAATLLPPILSLLGEDAGARAERALVDRLRQVPVSTLCAADLDLAAVGA